MDVDSSIRRAVVCTGNTHKVEELSLLLPNFVLEALPAGTQLPPEIGSTFLDNARIKVHAGAAMYPDRWIIADDSGLILDALDGSASIRGILGDAVVDAVVAVRRYEHTNFGDLDPDALAEKFRLAWSV